MKETKRALLRIFFVVEMVICTLFYLFGTHGMQALRRIAKENEQLGGRVAETRLTVAQLERHITLWHTSDFYKEKKAREQLQMAHADDLVYYER